MDVFECMATRRSIRKFKDLPVEMSKIGKIIDAGRSAPAAGNLQNWRFVLVTGQGLRHQIADACLQQYWVEHAPVHIVICAETGQLKQYYEERGEKVYALQNTAAAIENMILATHALGLGTCWVSAFEEDKIKRILDIPVGVMPVCVLPIGYPDEKPIEPARYSIEILTFFEEYGARIGDLQWLLGHYSYQTEKLVKQGKEIVKKVTKAVQK